MSDLFLQTAAALEIHSKSNFDLSTNSLLYPLFCSYGSGCFQNRVSEVEIFIDQNNNNHLGPKFCIKVKMFKDQKEAFSMLADTRDSPYKFELTSPHFLPKLIGVPSLEADMTHTMEGRSYQFAPTSQLLMTSNHPRVQTLDIHSSGIWITYSEISKTIKRFRQGNFRKTERQNCCESLKFCRRKKF